jgi:aminoglycoside phosphotransferase (APT) family kinase protein
MDNDTGQPHIDEALVRQLVATQFAHWADLPVRPVANGGWCNLAFHLGEHMVVRLPRHHAYAAQAEKEHQWLPRLAPLLPLATPQPLAIGEPAQGYPWKWSIYRWIQGDAARPENVSDMAGFAADLGRFLAALQRVESTGGPPPGPHNFHRGGRLATYDAQARQAIAALGDQIDTGAVVEVWESALASTRGRSPVWIHGDVSVGNLLVRNGRLCAVIDFGNLGVGDPACDLAMAWTLFENESREAFRAALPLDVCTWARGRGWVLWKALIIAAGLATSNAFEASRPWRIIQEVLDDHRRAEAGSRMRVNARNFDSQALGPVRIRLLDGASEGKNS